MNFSAAFNDGVKVNGILFTGLSDYDALFDFIEVYDRLYSFAGLIDLSFSEALQKYQKRRVSITNHSRYAPDPDFDNFIIRNSNACYVARHVSFDDPSLNVEHICCKRAMQLRPIPDIKLNPFGPCPVERLKDHQITELSCRCKGLLAVTHPPLLGRGNPVELNEVRRRDLIVLHLLQQKAHLVIDRASDKTRIIAIANLKNAGTNFSQSLIPAKELQ